MAHYVISDLHGEQDRFHRLLEIINLKEDDTLYIIGDVIDRGPQGIPLLQEIRAMKNACLLLGNHEYIMLDYFRPDAGEAEIRRWNRNGNAPTLQGWAKLRPEEQDSLLDYLRSLPSHLSLDLDCGKFYLVHGFYGENVHDDVWLRPTPASENPLYCRRMIIGHTKVSSLGREKEEKEAYLRQLEEQGRHLTIRHLPGFIDIDCGCGYFDLPMRRLACLRLEDFAEFYA